MTDLVRIGFMPLADAAIIVAAARLGFDRRENLRIELVRETSWANVRDRLAVGQFDAAHLLAPMPVAAALKRGALDVPLIAPMTLGFGGNAVSASAALWTELSATGLARPGDPVAMGAAMKALVAARRRAGRQRPVFAVVHAYSAHNFELRHWLAACGVAPDADVEIGVVPPPLAPEALASGAIDGFCVGEPWGSVAAARGVGRIVLLKSQIWTASPEKALALRADKAARDDDLVARLLAVLLDAAAWCAAPQNRDDLARLLAAPDALDVPADSIRPVLGGEIELADGEPGRGGLVFDDDATFPWRSYGRLFAHAMARWRQARPSPEDVERAAAAFRHDLYRRVASARGLCAPTLDERPDLAGNTGIAGSTGMMRLAPSRFFDEV